MENDMKIKKMLYLVLGCLGLGLGAAGAVLPVLPTVPFLMLAACCFAKSSARPDRWFRGTKLYRDNLETYVQGRGMTWQAKGRILLLVTALMSVGFVIMAAQAVWMGCAVLAGVWGFHVLYFLWGVKTLKSE